MADLDIKIENLDDIIQAFNRAPELVTREMIKAIRKSLFFMQGRSMLHTPVDTGRLRASHETFFEGLSGTLQTNVDYDIFVHEGTRFMKGRPFMRQAAEESMDEINEFFTEGLDNVLSEIGNAT